MEELTTPPLRAEAIRLGDSVSTDLLHPARYFSLDPTEVKRGFCRGLTDDQRRRIVDGGGVIVGGWDFGCGSSREVVQRALLLNDVRVVFAASFSRIFYRNCLLNGISCHSLGAAAGQIADGDQVELDLAALRIVNRTQGITVALDATQLRAPAFVRRYLELVGRAGKLCGAAVVAMLCSLLVLSWSSAVSAEAKPPLGQTEPASQQRGSNPTPPPPPTTPQPKRSAFGPLLRLESAYIPARTAALSAALFLQLPARTYLAASGTLANEPESDPRLNAENRYFGATAGFTPFDDGWWKTLSVVARYEVSTVIRSTGAGGLQWEPSRALVPKDARHPWKTFLQASAKNDVGYGVFDFMHWFSVFIHPRMQYRIVSNLYVTPRPPLAFRSAQDLMFKVVGPLDTFVQYVYQNVRLDVTRPNAHSFATGLRLTVLL